MVQNVEHDIQALRDRHERIVVFVCSKPYEGHQCKWQHSRICVHRVKKSTVKEERKRRGGDVEHETQALCGCHERIVCALQTQ